MRWYPAEGIPKIERVIACHAAKKPDKGMKTAPCTTCICYRVLDYHKVQCTANRQEIIDRVEIVKQSKYWEEAALQIPGNYHATAAEYGELINKGLEKQMKGET